VRECGISKHRLHASSVLRHLRREVSRSSGCCRGLLGKHGMICRPCNEEFAAQNSFCAFWRSSTQAVDSTKHQHKEHMEDHSRLLTVARLSASFGPDTKSIHFWLRSRSTFGFWSWGLATPRDERQGTSAGRDEGEGTRNDRLRCRVVAFAGRPSSACRWRSLAATLLSSLLSA
jgi:hypothetical protein